MTELAQSRVANWIQFALLLLAILTLALHGEGRLARVEQQLADAEQGRKENDARLTRIEEKIDLWRSTRR